MEYIQDIFLSHQYDQMKDQLKISVKYGDIKIDMIPPKEVAYDIINKLNAASGKIELISTDGVVYTLDKLFAENIFDLVKLSESTQINIPSDSTIVGNFHKIISRSTDWSASNYVANSKALAHYYIVCLFMLAANICFIEKHQFDYIYPPTLSCKKTKKRYIMNELLTYIDYENLPKILIDKVRDSSIHNIYDNLLPYYSVDDLDNFIDENATLGSCWDHYYRSFNPLNIGRERKEYLRDKIKECPIYYLNRFFIKYYINSDYITNKKEIALSYLQILFDNKDKIDPDMLEYLQSYFDEYRLLLIDNI